jgi:hypothetical protein
VNFKSGDLVIVTSWTPEITPEKIGLILREEAYNGIAWEGYSVLSDGIVEFVDSYKIIPLTCKKNKDNKIL